MLKLLSNIKSSSPSLFVLRVQNGEDPMNELTKSLASSRKRGLEGNFRPVSRGGEGTFLF